jgi:hypothetical protein
LAEEVSTGGIVIELDAQQTVGAGDIRRRQQAKPVTILNFDASRFGLPKIDLGPLEQCNRTEHRILTGDVCRNGFDHHRLLFRANYDGGTRKS